VAELPAETQPVIACAIINLAECNWQQLMENFVQLQVLPEDVDRENVADLSERILKPFVTGGGGVAAISQRIDSRQLAIDLAEATAGIPFQLPPYFALLSRAVSILEGIALYGDADYSLVGAASPVAAQWLLISDSPASQQAVNELMETSGLDGLMKLANIAGMESDERAMEMLVAKASNPRAAAAISDLARWMLTDNSLKAKTTLATLLARRDEDAEAVARLAPPAAVTVFAAAGPNMSSAMHGPLFLLELAVAATCADDTDDTFGTRATFSAEVDPEVPSNSPAQRARRCKEVQTAMEFLLTSSTPQVQQQVIAQAVHATDLCSRYIMRGMDRNGAAFTPQAVLGILPAFMRGGGSAALDMVFPPLTESETIQARELVLVAFNAFGIRDVEQLREILQPTAMVQSAVTGRPMETLQRFASNTFSSDSESYVAKVSLEITTQMRDMYIARLRNQEPQMVRA